MNILAIADIVPYPPNTGIKIRTYNILKQLSDGGRNRVFLLCFHNRTLLPTEESLRLAIDELKTICHHVEAFEIPTDRSALRKHGSMLLNIFQKLPHRCIRYYSTRCMSSIRRILANEAIDIIHLDKTELAVYADAFGSVPYVCTNHNVESKLMLSRAAYEKSFLRRQFARIQSRKLRDYEKSAISRADGYVTCTEIDQRFFESNFKLCGPHAVIDNGVDTDHYRPTRTKEPGRHLLIVGAQSIEATANFDGTHYFMKEVWPFIVAKQPELIVRIVGRDPDRTISAYDDGKNVKVVGFVDDERNEFSEAIALVVPLRVGGGSRLKILVAMSMGVPVVSTRIGAEGIDAVDGESIVLADDPREFADAVIRIVESQDLRVKLSKNARDVALARYDWNRLGEKLRGFYRSVIAIKRQA